jgi:hypothetical protein
VMRHLDEGFELSEFQIGSPRCQRHRTAKC